MTVTQHPRLLIECGIDSLAPFSSSQQSCLEERIICVEGIAASHGIELEVLIYTGMVTRLSGGRPTDFKMRDVESIVHSLNSSGRRMNLAINGGLNSGPDLALKALHDLDYVLSMLTESTLTHGVKNSVIITHPRLFEYISNEYPDLGTVASCIQALYPFCQYDYGKAFRTYDCVVPLNQHTTPEFLEQYSNYSPKMLVFLTLGCGTSNLAKCFDHYTHIESEYLNSENAPAQPNNRRFAPLPSQLADKRFNCDNADLASRERDLACLIRMGVNMFKVPRNGILRESVFLKLLSFVNRRSEY